MKLIYVMLLALCILSGAIGAAETPPASTDTPVEVFEGPSSVEKPPALYPTSERKRGGEGWVIVNMMIGRDGKPYEATVASSSGNPAFEKSALETVENKWRFNPATLNGAPIEAGTRVKLTFRLTGESAARPAFAATFADLIKAVDADDHARADSLHAQLKARNLYEDAYQGLADYAYYKKWGTDQQQLDGIRRAIAGEKTARYLPQGAFATALQAQLGLEIKLQDYARAWQTWHNLLDVVYDEPILSRWRKSIDDIRALRTSDKAYAVTGEIGASSSWFYDLLKHKFQVEVTSGSIAEVKLRCDRQFVLFRFDPALQYTISGNDRTWCSMELVGQPGTQFRLTQL